MNSNIPQDMRSHILQTATRLFVIHGYNGISMREIASASGLSKPGIYYHFQDKEALLVAILEENLEHLGNMIQTTRDNNKTVQEQITAMIRGIFLLSPEQRAVVRLASQEISHIKPEAQTRFAVLYHEKFVGQIESMLTEGVQRGEFHPLNAPLTTWILMGMIFPFIFPAQENLVYNASQPVDQILDVFFCGITQKSEPVSKN